jgi:hypothetical protein
MIRRLLALLFAAALLAPAAPVRAAAADEPDAAAQAWHYGSSGAGINLAAVTDRSDGNGVVVAVLDSGIVTHPDLLGRILPGADLISDPLVAGDDTPRDANAVDQGNACTAPVSPSTWSGLHLAGLIAADADNGLGGAGIAPGASILPVRVSGKCGTTALSDLLDGLRWAAGLAVRGMATNPTPADVLLVGPSLSGRCDATVRAIIDEIHAAGALIITGAGNIGSDANGAVPGGCAGVLTVGSLDGSADLAARSNAGGLVDLVAPGGGTDLTDPGVSSTSNAGAKAAASPTSGVRRGSAVAAAHVAGVAALLWALAPELPPAGIAGLLVRAAAPLPDATRCHTRGCGAGRLDAGASVDLLLAEAGSTVTDAITVIPPTGSVVDELLALPEATDAGVPLRAVSMTPAVCHVTDGGLLLVGRGRCTAALLSDGAFGVAAVTTTMEFEVEGLPTTIELEPLGTRTVTTSRWPIFVAVNDNQSYNLTAAGPCSIAGGYLLLRSTGTCRYRIAVPGDARHRPASLAGSFLITAGAPEPLPDRLPAIAPPTLIAAIGATSPSGRIELRWAPPVGNAATGHTLRCVAPDGAEYQASAGGLARIGVVAVARGREYTCTVSANRGGALPGISSPSAAIPLPRTPATPVLLSATPTADGVTFVLADPGTPDFGPTESFLIEGLAEPISVPIDPLTRTATLTVDGYSGAPRLTISALGALPLGVGRSIGLPVSAPRLGAPPVSAFAVTPDPVATSLTAIATISLPSIVAGDLLRLSIDGVPVPFVLTTPAGVRRPDADGWATLTARPTSVLLRATVPLTASGPTTLTLAVRESGGAIGTATALLNAPLQLPAPSAVTGSVTSVSAVRLSYGYPAGELAYLRGFRTVLLTPAGTTATRTFGPLLRSLAIAIPSLQGEYTITLIATGVLPDSAPVRYRVVRDTSGLSISPLP